MIFLYDHAGRHLVDSRPFFNGFGTLWEGGIRVPLSVRWPRVAQTGAVIEQPAIAMDVSATILEASHLEHTPISAPDGLCLRPFMDSTSSVEEPAFIGALTIRIFSRNEPSVRATSNICRTDKHNSCSTCATLLGSAKIYWERIQISSVICGPHTRRGQRPYQSDCADWLPACAYAISATWS